MQQDSGLLPHDPPSVLSNGRPVWTFLTAERPRTFSRCACAASSRPPPSAAAQGSGFSSVRSFCSTSEAVAEGTPCSASEAVSEGTSCREEEGGSPLLSSSSGGGGGGPPLLSSYTSDWMRGHG